MRVLSTLIRSCGPVCTGFPSCRPQGAQAAIRGSGRLLDRGVCARRGEPGELLRQLVDSRLPLPVGFASPTGLHHPGMSHSFLLDVNVYAAMRMNASHAAILDVLRRPVCALPHSGRGADDVQWPNGHSAERSGNENIRTDGGSTHHAPRGAREPASGIVPGAGSVQAGRGFRGGTRSAQRGSPAKRARRGNTGLMD